MAATSRCCQLLAIIGSGALLLLLFAPPPAAAYPNLWRQCDGQHPETALGMHGAPRPDTSASFVLEGLGRPQVGYCPGATYKVKVSFSSARKALLTASPGQLGSSNGCDGARVAFSLTLPSQQTDLSIPCGATGACIGGGRFYM